MSGPVSLPPARRNPARSARETEKPTAGSPTPTRGTGHSALRCEPSRAKVPKPNCRPRCVDGPDAPIVFEARLGPSWLFLQP
jgi:hypothetical protein